MLDPRIIVPQSCRSWLLCICGRPFRPASSGAMIDGHQHGLFWLVTLSRLDLTGPGARIWINVRVASRLYSRDHADGSVMP
jgi:hypothetical protein